MAFHKPQPFLLAQKPCLRNRVVLTGLTDDLWTEAHDATMDLFLKDKAQQLLVLYIDDFAGLKVELLMPHQVGLTLHIAKGPILHMCLRMIWSCSCL